MKQNSRKSSDPVSSGRVAESQNVKQDEDSVTLSNMMNILNQINGKLVGISRGNDELKLSMTNRTDSGERNKEFELSTVMSRHLTELHAKLDQHFMEIKSAETKSCATIVRKLNELQDKENQPLSSKLQTKTFSKSNGTPSNRNKDSLDWSFSFNQSVLPNDNSELYQLLSGFEKNTWTSFDYLRHKLNDNTDKVINIESSINKFTSDGINKRIESPLTDTIKIDALQQIQDRCESIERKLMEINSLQPVTSNDMTHNAIDYTTSRNKEVNSIVTQASQLERISLEFRPENGTPASRSSQLKLDNEIHVSKLPTSTTCEELKLYMARKGTFDMDKIKAFRLTKKDQDISKLSFLSFKVETDSEIAVQLLRKEFWPSHVTVKPWKRKVDQIPRLSIETAANHFLSRTGSVNHMI